MKPPPVTFFENQAAARNRTALLVFYFGLAVIILPLLIYAAVIVSLLQFGGSRFLENHAQIYWQPKIFLNVAVSTWLIILAGSVAKILELSKGGSAVAQLLGGRPVRASTATPGERVLLNVVEEMSIASGVRIPEVFVLPTENSINAFAAGLTPNDAVVAVTKGCIDKLTRDELQGVVAHEFSHILNSDMRLNLRLTGVLHGLLLIAMVGRFLMRTRGRKNPVPLLGLALFVLGYVGVWFGSLIKCAVSRQREFLADASSVQFTRNPLGLGGALKKIGRESLHGVVSNPHAEEVSHFFFADGVKRARGNLLSTHPPIPERLRRLRVDTEGIDAAVLPAAGDLAAVADPAAVTGFVAPDAVAVDPEAVAQSAGTIRARHIEWARSLLGSLSPVLVDAAREPFSARAVVYCLLLGRDTATRDAQANLLARAAEGPVNAQVTLLSDRVKNLAVHQAMALADLAIHTLRSLSPQQYQTFRATAWDLINADRRVTLFEYMLQRMVIRHLDPVFGRQGTGSDRAPPPRPLPAHVASLLAAVACSGSDDDVRAKEAYDAGIARLRSFAGVPPMPECAGVNLAELDAALAALEATEPATRAAVIDACTVTVARDGVTTPAESIILRAVADALGCPVPPLIAAAPDRPR